jgi:hypothetical protein
LKFGIGVGIGERIAGKGNLVKTGNGHQGLIFDEKIKILPFDHRGGHKFSPIVFILGENIAKHNDMQHGRKLAEIRNSKWPRRGFSRLIFYCKNNTFASSSPW